LDEKHNPLKKPQLIAIALAAVMVLPLNATAAPPSFTQEPVALHITSGEPRIFVDPNDPGAAGNPATVYDVWPEAGNAVAKSTDGGATWSAPVTTLGGGGDADIAIDGGGCVYVVDLFNAGSQTTKLPVSRSCGATLSFTASAFADAGGGTLTDDRPWIAARGTGASATVVVTESSTKVWRSVGSPMAFALVGTIDTAGSAIQGNLVYSGSTLWNIYSNGGVITYAKSTNDGTTWTKGTIATEVLDPVLFPVIALDTSGNVYAVWTQTTNAIPLVGTPLHTEIHYSKSTNGGTTWSTPIVVSDPTRSALFPWITARSAGKVDIEYVQDNPQVSSSIGIGPDLGLPVTQWDVILSQSLNASAAVPSFTTVTAVKGFHTGSICTSGLLCIGPQNLGLGNLPTPFDRRMLDFFSIASDGLGNALIAYGKDRPFPGILVGDLVESWIDMNVAVQSAGDRI
jgi:hypothetical protein